MSDLSPKPPGKPPTGPVKPLTGPVAKVVTMGPPWRRHLRRGLQYLQSNDFAQAAHQFESALSHGPKEPEVLLALGRERMRQGRYLEARPLLERALDGRPDSVAAVASLARLLGLHLQASQAAFELLHAFLDKHPDANALQIVRGELLLEDGAYIDARAAFGMVLDGDTTDASARIGLARTYNAEGIALSDRGQSEQAIFAFKRAADLDDHWAGRLLTFLSWHTFSIKI